MRGGSSQRVLSHSRVGLSGVGLKCKEVKLCPQVTQQAQVKARSPGVQDGTPSSSSHAGVKLGKRELDGIKRIFSFIKLKSVHNEK